MGIGDHPVVGAGVDLGGYGIEVGVYVADTIIVRLEFLFGLGVVGGVVVAADSGLASAGDLATIQCGTDDAYLAEFSWPSCWR